MADASYNSMETDRTKTKCPNPKCRRQDKIDVIERVGEKCFRVQCLACAKLYNRRIPITTTWTELVSMMPQYVLDEHKNVTKEEDITS